jgi:hypothetical protein
MRYLYDADSELRRLELTCKPGEPTVRLGTGVYRFEEDVSDPQYRRRKRVSVRTRSIARRRKT